MTTRQAAVTAQATVATDPADLQEHGSWAVDGQGLGELLVAGRGL